MKKRYVEFDYIRVFAAISIIVIHATSRYIYDSRMAYYANQFVRFAVPLFIILSGLLLFLSDGSQKSNALNFYKKRARKMIIPFAVWTAFYIIFSNIAVVKAGKFGLHDFIALFFKGLIYGNGYDHLYFMTIIIQLYLLYPILNYLISRWQYPALIISFAVTLTYQAGVYLQMLNMIKLPWTPLPYYEFFPTWIFYFVFGMYLGKNITGFERAISNKKVIIGSVWLTSLALLILDSRVTKIYESIRPSIIFYCVMTFLFTYCIAVSLNAIDERLNNIAKWISMQSFMIYLSHLVFMKISSSLFVHLGLAGRINNAFYVVLLFAVTTALTLVFAFAVSITPFAGYLGGVRVKKTYMPQMVPTDNKF
ncbi:MAG TPA: acyltransferase [Clostridia bacterium]